MTPYDSLCEQQLRQSQSIKWSKYPADVIPLWIADMDFPVAQSIREALTQRIQDPLVYIPENCDEHAFIQKLLAKLAHDGLDGLSCSGLKFFPSVVPALYASIFALANVGERVVMLTPVYHPFHQATTEQGRVPVGVALRCTETGWEIDWEALEEACRGARLLMICHPHNPVGRVWNNEELSRLREIAIRHDLFVVSDELHSDLRYHDIPFQGFAADPAVRNRTLTVTGPCKAFNTPGLGIGVMATHNLELLDRVKKAVTGLSGHPSALAYEMWHAALSEGDDWLANTLVYLQENRDFLATFIEEKLPLARMHTPESTYLAWIDLRAYGKGKEIQTFLLNEAKVAVHDGALFAPEGNKEHCTGYIRVNFATPRAILKEALERIARALNN